jgi:hypothetical protein
MTDHGRKATEPIERRSLKYIRLAAFLADQPEGVDKLVMSVPQIEEIVGETLPPSAKFPSWWRNDSHRAHSRAWLTAGWEVAAMDRTAGTVEFVKGLR